MSQEHVVSRVGSFNFTVVFSVVLAGAFSLEKVDSQCRAYKWLEFCTSTYFISGVTDGN